MVPLATCEPLARAVISLPHLSHLEVDRVRSFVASSSVQASQGLRCAALLNFPGAERRLADSSIFTGSDWGRRSSTIEEAMRFIYDRLVLSRTEMAKVHPWIYRQLRNVLIKVEHMPSDALSHGESIFKFLLANLSPNHSPSLEDELLFLMLYRIYTAKLEREPHPDDRDLMKHVYFHHRKSGLLEINAEVGCLTLQ
jgi:hypothetical protein